MNSSWGLELLVWFLIYHIVDSNEYLRLIREINFNSWLSLFAIIEFHLSRCFLNQFRKEISGSCHSLDLWLYSILTQIILFVFLVASQNGLGS